MAAVGFVACFGIWWKDGFGWACLSLLLVFNSFNTGWNLFAMKMQATEESEEREEPELTSAFDLMNQLSSEANAREKRRSIAVNAAMQRQDVLELLAAKNRSGDSLACLCNLLEKCVPEENRLYEAIGDVEKLEWFFSIPDCPDPLDRFPDETTRVRFSNWVRYGMKPKARS